jgi:hypothetical protein
LFVSSDTAADEVVVVLNSATDVNDVSLVRFVKLFGDDVFCSVVDVVVSVELIKGIADKVNIKGVVVENASVVVVLLVSVDVDTFPLKITCERMSGNVADEIKTGISIVVVSGMYGVGVVVVVNSSVLDDDSVVVVSV